VKRVLLTGAGGFVGSHMLRHLLMNTDYEIVCPVTFRHRGNADRIFSSIGKHCTRHEQCLPDPTWVERVDVVMSDLAGPISDITAERFGSIDLIINMASQSHVDRSIEDPVGFIRNNVELIFTMLEYARRAKPDHFIQLSTDEVYGPLAIGEEPHAEWAPFLPSNPYAASKAAQESIAVSYWRTYGLPLTIVNAMNLVGEMQDKEKYAPMVMRAVMRGEPVKVHAAPDGTIGSRFFLHPRNLADAILHIWESGPPPEYPDKLRPGKFHVVGEKELSNLELAQFIADAMDKPLRYELVDFHSSRPGHDLRYGLDGSKIEATGWKPPIPLDGSIAKTVQWTLDHPQWLL
jgi:dTDP-glucose 4,6-dehydratase